MSYTTAGGSAPIRRFSIGRVLSQSLSIYLNNIVSMTFVLVAAFLPLIIATGLMVVTGAVTTNELFGTDSIDPSTSAKVFGTAMIIGLIVSLLLYPVAIAVITDAAFQQLRTGRMNLGAAIGNGFARSLWVLLVFLLIFLAIYAVMLVIGVVLGGAIALTSGNPSTAIAIITGLAALILFFTLYIMWSVAVPATVIERVGPIKSMGRSRNLTKDYRWHIILIFIVTILMTGLLSVAAQFGLAAALASMPLVAVILIYLIQSSLGALFLIVPTVIYHDLVITKENMGIQKVAGVFD